MTTDTLSTTLYAVADPTRRAILARLLVGNSTITELAQPFSLSLPAITKHVRILEEAGLIQKTKQAQWRPCKLRHERLQEVSSWLDPYRQLWETRLDLLGAYLEGGEKADPSP
ncbi:MAG TPA: metalloregulator ArsR/SmtB family transcription factor [Capsulimonadaceae bacterium]|jgi:DNA-binding transcriptional ArsR family regulator